MTSTDPHRLDSVRLLEELVNNHLDAGYRQAAQRRNGKASPRWYDRPLVALGCVLAGFLGVVGYVHTHRAAPEEAKVHDQLVQRVRSDEKGTDALAAQVDATQRQVSAVQRAALPSAGDLSRDLAAEQVAAGEVPVHGPGITVTLREPPTSTTSPSPPARGGSTPIDATSILTDRDVRSVANELWHDGAEAMAVNGVRLTPTSAIRFAGSAVLVDLQPVTSPYRVEAVGEADALSTAFAQSAVAGRYQTLVSADHIGFDVAEDARLDLPASPAAALRFAVPGRAR